jgi:hypothetical protein
MTRSSRLAKCCRPSRLRMNLMLALAACFAGIQGCVIAPLPGPPPYHVILAPGYDPAVQHRLLIMPIVGLEGDAVASGMITDAIVNELRAIGPFEVVMADPIPCPTCAPPPPLFPSEQDLALLMERHRPDAFVFVTVNRYSPYPPLELGLSVRVVGAYDRQTLASIDTLRNAAQDIPFSNGDCTVSHPAEDLLLADAAVTSSSPTLYARHVAMYVAHALALKPLPSPATESGWSILPKPGRSHGWFAHSPKNHAAPQ